MSVEDSRDGRGLNGSLAASGARNDCSEQEQEVKEAESYCQGGLGDETSWRKDRGSMG